MRAKTCHFRNHCSVVRPKVPVFLLVRFTDPLCQVTFTLTQALFSVSDFSGYTACYRKRNEIFVEGFFCYSWLSQPIEYFIVFILKCFYNTCPKVHIRP